MWPAKSPDINLIENVWSRMEMLLNRDRVKSVYGFKRSVIRVWDKISQEYISSLYESLPSRLQAVIEADGWQTRY